jgi:hypothetical protein
MVSLGVKFLGSHDMPFGAEMNAEMALFAKLLVDLNVSFQNVSPISFCL